jgi:hypothetical protein
MQETRELKEFYETHRLPDKAGIKSLFKFSRFNENLLEYPSHLFIERKLYHSRPTQFNDPFECKPHFKWPDNPEKVKAIQQYLINAAIQNGHAKDDAESLISKIINDPKFLQETILKAILKNLSEVRICSFTTQKENLLLWSHYTNSHEGFCVEYDATKFPIAYTFKVLYQDEYPEAVYPWPIDATGFRPLLIKSKDWMYENEFRSIFVPAAERRPNDGESLILKGDEIKNVYFGSNMSPENKTLLSDLIRRGPFRPRILDTNISKSSFRLKFSERR